MIRQVNGDCRAGKGATCHYELQKLKEIADKWRRESDTPEKDRELLKKTGYLNADGCVSEQFR
jgi:hypothetical protein